MKQQKWYKSWFNSSYYHVLYKDRNTQEAESFMSLLNAHLQLPNQAKVLDIACGKGRHAVYLRKLNLDVTGIDLSENSIAYAKRYEDEYLRFFVHDMRKLLYINYFDLAVNLFTSFGYFDTNQDHLRALKAFRKGLSKNGIFVLDYFNTHKVIGSMQAHTVKTVDHIDFKIDKSVVDGKILKRIQFEADGEQHDYTERVSAFRLEDFEILLNLAGFKIQQTFGDYGLGAYDKEQSDRLILICKKI